MPAGDQRSCIARNLVGKRFRDELGYRSALAWPICSKEHGGRVHYHMIHASDHLEAPKLMHRAYHKAVTPKRFQSSWVFHFNETRGRPNSSQDGQETISEWRDRTALLPRNTPAGRRIAVCPATYSNATCKSCGACARPRAAVIGFPAHGAWRQARSRNRRTRRGSRRQLGVP